MVQISKIIPESLDSNKEYVIRVRSVNALGNTSDWSESLYIDTAQTVAGANLVNQGDDDFSILNDKGELVFGAFSQQDLRDNLCPNPTFELDTFGWSSLNNTTFIRSGSGARYGSYCGRVSVVDQTVQSGVGIKTAEPSYITVTPGSFYTFSFYGYRNYRPELHATFLENSNLKLTVNFYNVSNEAVGSVSPSSSTQIENNVWTRVFIENVKIPAGVSKVGITIEYDKTPNDTIFVEEYLQIDGVLIEQSSKLKTYFDGSLADKITSWVGTPHASVSRFDNRNENTLTFKGNISGGSIDIGGLDNSSFHVDGTGKLWLGAAEYDDAPFKVSAEGIASISGGVRTYSQPSAPTGLTSIDEGSLWVDTDANNKMYRWSGTAWQLYKDDAASDIVTNTTTITGGNIETGNLQSSSYSGVVNGSAFSTNGTNISLDNGSITAENFRIDTSGNAHFRGNITGSSISGGEINIGTGDFYVNTAGQMWLGATTYAAAPFKVNNNGTMTASSANITGAVSATSFTLLDGGTQVAKLYSSDTSYERLRFNVNLAGYPGEYWDIGWQSENSPFGDVEFFIKPNVPANPTFSQLDNGMGLKMFYNNLSDAVSLRGSDSSLYFGTPNFAILDNGLVDIALDFSTIKLRGNTEIEGWARGNNGGTASPTYSFRNDTDTGMYLDSGGSIGWAIAGSERLQMGGSYMNFSGRINYAAAINVDGGNAIGSPAYTFIQDTDTGIRRESANSIELVAGAGRAGLFRQGTVWLPGAWNQTTASAANVRVNDSAGVLQRSTSSILQKKLLRRVKDEESALLVEAVAASAFVYTSRIDTDRQDQEYVGVAAETAAANGAEILVDYDHNALTLDGEPTKKAINFQYERVVAPLAVEHVKLKAQVEVQQEQIEAQQKQINSLIALLEV